MRIKKLAGGGLPAFVSYTNVELALPAYAGIGSSSSSDISSKSSSSSSKGESKSGDIGLLNKEMQKILMENGLPSDVRYLLSKVDVFGNNIDPLDPHSLERIYSKLLSIIPEIKANKAAYDDAALHAREKGTIDSVAIASNGGVYVLKENGQVGVVDAFTATKNGMTKLTNGLLLQYRAFEKPMDLNIISNVVSSSISIQDITDNVIKIIDKVGKDSVTQEGFTRKDSKSLKISDAISKLIDAGEDGVYKITSKKITSDLNAQYLLDYILAKLQPNEKGVLENIAASNGLDKKNGVRLILTQLIRGQLDSTVETQVSFDNQATKGATDNNGKSVNNIEVKSLYEYLTGKGGQEEKVPLVPGGNIAMVVSGKFYGLPIGSDGNPILKGSFSNFLNSGIASITDIRNGVYFGNLRIDSSEYDKLMYDGTQLSRVLLPYEIDKNGTIHPDFNLIKSFSKIYKMLESGNYSKEDRIRILQENGFAEYILPNGEWNPNKVKPFLVTKAYGSGSSNGLLGLFGKQDGVVDPALVEVDDEQYLVEKTNSKYLQADMINTLSTKDHPIAIGDKIYEGMIFMPVINATDLSMIASREYPIQGQSSDSIKLNDIRYIDAMKKTSNYISANSSKLE